MPRYRSHMISPLEALWTPPNLPSLYAWFKYNEGSGITPIDYSPYHINGALQTAFGNPTAKFWSVSGFGHNDFASAPLTWFYAYNRPTIDSNCVSMIGFVKPKSAIVTNWSVAMWHGVGGFQNWMKIGWRYVADPYLHGPYWLCAFENCNGAFPASGGSWTKVPITLDTWYCIYALSDVLTHRAKLYYRISGNPFQLLFDVPHDYSYHAAISGVVAFGGNNTNAAMDGGDMLWWLANDSSGIISLAQANDVYNNLKYRYGM